MLRSPFPALADVGAHHYPYLPVRLLLRDDFPVSRHLADSEVPVTVIYGDPDSVVPTELSARVADDAPSLVDRVVLAGRRPQRRGDVRTARRRRRRATGRQVG